MDETEFIRKYMSLTGCNETEARSAYLYVDTQPTRDAALASPDTSPENTSATQPQPTADGTEPNRSKP